MSKKLKHVLHEWPYLFEILYSFKSNKLQSPIIFLGLCHIFLTIKKSKMPPPPIKRSILEHKTDFPKTKMPEGGGGGGGISTYLVTEMLKRPLLRDWAGNGRVEHNYKAFHLISLLMWMAYGRTNQKPPQVKGKIDPLPLETLATQTAHRMQRKAITLVTFIALNMSEEIHQKLQQILQKT